jgi:hypothetical protein
MPIYIQMMWITDEDNFEVSSSVCDNRNNPTSTGCKWNWWHVIAQSMTVEALQNVSDSGTPITMLETSPKWELDSSGLVEREKKANKNL